jgi:hypothetical protein
MNSTVSFKLLADKNALISLINLSGTNLGFMARVKNLNLSKLKDFEVNRIIASEIYKYR